MAGILKTQPPAITHVGVYYVLFRYLRREVGPRPGNPPSIFAFLQSPFDDSGKQKKKKWFKTKRAYFIAINKQKVFVETFKLIFVVIIIIFIHLYKRNTKSKIANSKQGFNFEFF